MAADRATPPELNVGDLITLHLPCVVRVVDVVPNKVRTPDSMEPDLLLAFERTGEAQPVRAGIVGIGSKVSVDVVRRA